MTNQLKSLSLSVKVISDQQKDILGPGPTHLSGYHPRPTYKRIKKCYVCGDPNHFAIDCKSDAVKVR